MHGRNIADLMTANMPAGDTELLRALGELARSRNTKAFVVGGVVRDLLLGIRNCDLDVVVEEDAAEFAAAAARALGGSVKAHTRFGTAVLVVPEGRKIDLATTRSETYERPGALPTVSAGSIEGDLVRRDFTINSLAVSLNPDAYGDVLDPHGGFDDLGRGSIRVLTDASFEDDPTRILRAVRFSARFGFSLEAETERLLRQAAEEDRLATVSGERILNEIVLILTEKDPWPPMNRLSELGVLESMIEGWRLSSETKGVFGELRALLAPIPGPWIPEGGDSWTAFFLAALTPLGSAARAALVERLAAGRRVRDLVRQMSRFESDAVPVLTREEDTRRSTIFRTLEPYSAPVLAVAVAGHVGSRLAERVLLHVMELSGVASELDGRDLAELGLREGTAVGRVLSALLDARLDGIVTTAEEERSLASELLRNLDADGKN